MSAEQRRLFEATLAEDEATLLAQLVAEAREIGQIADSEGPTFGLRLRGSSA